MLYEFELSHYAEEATKNIFWSKAEGPVDRRIVTDGSRNFSRVARTSMIMHGQVSQVS